MKEIPYTSGVLWEKYVQGVSPLDNSLPANTAAIPSSERKLSQTIGGVCRVKAKQSFKNSCSTSTQNGIAARKRDAREAWRVAIYILY